MHRRSVLVAFVLLASVFALSVPFVSDAMAPTLYVGGGGPGNHTTIQSAVDNASAGDTVFVFSGTYNESVIVNKTLSLVGEDRDTTVVNFAGSHYAVNIIANWTNVSSFTLKGSASWTTGIGLESVHNCTLSGNNITSHQYGIDSHRSRDNTYAGNLISASSYAGLYLDESRFETATNNAFTGDGLFIEGSSREYWNTHSIDTTNTVNGRPLQYWSDAVGGTVPTGAGQVILANCSQAIVEGQNISGPEAGIVLGFSDNSTVANSTVSYSTWGIMLRHSRDDVIVNNTLAGNGRGIGVYDSHGNVISWNNGSYDITTIILDGSNDNTIDNNTMTSYNPGIYLKNSHGNSIVRNNITNQSAAGIEVYWSHSNIIAWNIVTPLGFGIKVHRSNGNIVENNTVTSQIGHGMLIWISDNNTINGNTVYGCWEGFWISDAHNNTYSGNNVSSNIEGFVISMSTNSRFDSNFVSWNTYSGFYFMSSVNMTLTNNVMERNGIYISGYIVDMWNSHSIDTTNTVNSKPVRYWKDVVGGTVQPGAGEVILANCTQVRIENQNISDATVGVHIGFSSDSTIANNTVPGHSYYGIHLYRSSRNLVTNNTASSNLVGIFSLHSDNNTFDDNSVSLSSYHGLELADSFDSTVSNNTIIRNSRKGILLLFSRGNDVVSNNASSNGEEGIYVDGESDGFIANNTVLNNTYNGISLRYGSSEVMGNNASGNGVSGINLNTFRGSLTRNTVLDNSYYGIGIFTSQNMTVAGTTASGNPVGIYSDSSVDVTLRNNTAEGNTHGIFLNHSDLSTVVGNTVQGNTRGISLYGSNQNTLARNRIANNTEWGIHANASSFNRIYHNLILNNSQQGFDSFMWNLWHNGYPSGGNFWSDYTGVDEKVGPSQDQPGSDGIGDTPYSVAGGMNMDLYPLMARGPPPMMPPSAPLNLQATAGNEQVSLNWSAPAFGGRSPVTNYTIYRGTSPGSEVFLVEVGNVTAHVDTGLTNGQAYYYQVAAKNSLGEGNRSNEANATPATVPGPPVNLTAEAGDGMAILSWSPPIDDGGSPITNYTIYRGPSPGGEVFLAEVGSVLNYTDGGLVNGQAYYYRVSATNAKGEGALSNEVSVTPSPSPRAPAGVDAFLSGNLENVTLSWSLSPDDGTGFGSVVAYDVLRGGTYSPSGAGYSSVGNVPNGTVEFVDTLAGEGDPGSYFYRVCAVDASGRTGCSSGQAGKFTRPLAAGPNLVSIPLIPSDEPVETVLQTVMYDMAWSYDTSSGEWRWHMKAKEYGGLTNLDHTMGLWVNVTQDCNLTVAGIVPAQTTIHLRSGWNLISFPSFNPSYTVADLKAELPVERVEGFDASAPPHFLRVLQDSDVLLAGQGYWVKVSADATWVVSNG